MTPENRIKRDICEYLKTQKDIFFWTTKTVGTYDPSRGIFRKNTDPFYIRGVSDILGLFEDGRFLAIEVKTKTGRLSDFQREFLERVKAMGGLAIVARSVDDVRAILEPPGGSPTLL